jgi:hypothetical protein
MEFKYDTFRGREVKKVSFQQTNVGRWLLKKTLCIPRQAKMAYTIFCISFLWRCVVSFDWNSNKDVEIGKEPCQIGQVLDQNRKGKFKVFKCLKF